MATIHVHVHVLCYFALFVCLTLLASFFLPSHLSLKHVCIYMYVTLCIICVSQSISNWMTSALGKPPPFSTPSLPSTHTIPPSHPPTISSSTNSSTSRSREVVSAKSRGPLSSGRSNHHSQGSKQSTDISPLVAGLHIQCHVFFNGDLQYMHVYIYIYIYMYFLSTTYMYMLTLLASFFLPSHLSFKNMYMYILLPLRHSTRGERHTVVYETQP